MNTNFPGPSGKASGSQLRYHRQVPSLLIGPVAIMALLLNLLIGQPPLSATSANTTHCEKGDEIQHSFIYYPDSAVSDFSIDHKACFSRTARLKGEISRQDPLTGDRSQTVRRAKCLQSDPQCGFALSIEHPGIERATYTIEISWISQDGSEKIKDSLHFTAAGCTSLLLFSECVDP